MRRGPLGGALLALAALTSALGAGCDSDETETETEPPATIEIQEGCNPIGGAVDCLLPYPSDIYRAEAGLTVPEAARVKFDGNPGDLHGVFRPDGFSVGPPILVALGVSLDDTALPFWTDETDRSQSLESPTLLLDAETGELVAHFAELDPRAVDPLRQALILRPLDRLKDGHRYIVALQHLITTDGDEVPPNDAFLNLRDRAGDGHEALAALSSHYESSIFPVLETASIPRSSLILAWDFTTRSANAAEGSLRAIEADLESHWQAGPPEITWISTEQNPGEHIERRVEFTMKVPRYVDTDEPGSHLLSSFDPNEFIDVPFTVWVPPSVASGKLPARLLQFGHGFFGTRFECDGFPSAFADTFGFVVVATDWWGLSEPDRAYVAGALVTDPEESMRFSDRIHQGFANALTLGEVASTVLADDPALRRADDTPFFDETHLWFYGISMGHILGSTTVALSPRIERATLGVGGVNFGTMMFRAGPFQPFLALLQTQNSDPLDQQKFAAMSQDVLDRIDPMTYARDVRTRPGGGARPILVHVGLADTQVPNLATFQYAKMAGLPILESSSAKRPLGLSAEPAPESALVIFDFGLEESPLAMAATTSNDVHGQVRGLEASQAQVDLFFAPDGAIEPTCEGTCDPE